MNITEHDTNIIIGALYTAIDKYKTCAKDVSATDLPEPQRGRLVESFNQQVSAAAAVLEKLEG